MSHLSKITSKGQTTVPKEIRDRLNLKPGDRVEFVIEGDEVVLKARNKSALELAGVLHDPHRKTVSIEDMNEAVGRCVLERFERSRERD